MIRNVAYIDEDDDDDDDNDDDDDDDKLIIANYNAQNIKKIHCPKFHRERGVIDLCYQICHCIFK